MRSSDVISHEGVTLISHLESVARTAEHLARVSLPEDVADSRLVDTVWLCGMLHDYGKATTSFQNKIRGRPHNVNEARHSLLSAVVALENVSKMIRQTTGPNVSSMLPVFAMLSVARHHGNLGSALNSLSLNDGDMELLRTQLDQIDSGFVDDLRAMLEARFSGPIVEPDDLLSCLEDLHKRLSPFRRDIRKNTGLRFWLQLSMLYSLLIDADKLEASGLGIPSRGVLPADFAVRTVHGFGPPARPIDHLRQRAFQEALRSVDSIDLHQRIISLTLPTGLGKTLTSIAMAQRLRDRVSRDGHVPRIIYCLPFTAIVDQNHEVFYQALGGPSSATLLKHHHIGDTLYCMDNTEDALDYHQSELMIEGWNSEIVVTTFVQLFFTLAGHRNRPMRRFHSLAESIVILDEVQSIPYKYWSLFSTLARSLSEEMGTRFILVTATQPCIFDHVCEAIPDPEYYFSQTSRVDIDIDLTPRGLEEFQREVLETIRSNPDKSVLSVMNTKRSAETLYDFLANEEPGLPLSFLTSLVVPKQRLERIERLRKADGGRRIAVSTQVVEAGVDVDFDIVFRDFAPMDSIVQACGRCNRHMSEERGQFNVRYVLDDRDSRKRSLASYIYDPMLLDATRELLSQHEELRDVDLHRMTVEYFRAVSSRGEQHTSKGIIESLKSLDYSSLEQVRLIEDQIPNMVDVFVELDDEAEAVLREYRNVLESRMDRFSRRERLLKIRRSLTDYMISVHGDDVGALPTLGWLAVVHRHEIGRRYSDVTGFIPSGRSATII